jgi:hypothetical protein
MISITAIVFLSHIISWGGIRLYCPTSSSKTIKTTLFLLDVARSGFDPAMPGNLQQSNKNMPIAAVHQRQSARA